MLCKMNFLFRGVARFKFKSNAIRKFRRSFCSLSFSKSRLYQNYPKYFSLSSNNNNNNINNNTSHIPIEQRPDWVLIGV